MEEVKEVVKDTLKASRFEIEQQLNNFLGNLKIEGLS